MANILTLARDNKWQDIERMVKEQGVPVMHSNAMGQVRDARVLPCARCAAAQRQPRAAHGAGGPPWFVWGMPASLATAGLARPVP